MNCKSEIRVCWWIKRQKLENQRYPCDFQKFLGFKRISIKKVENENDLQKRDSGNLTFLIIISLISLISLIPIIFTKDRKIWRHGERIPVARGGQYYVVVVFDCGEYMWWWNITTMRVTTIFLLFMVTWTQVDPRYIDHSRVKRAKGEKIFDDLVEKGAQL